MQKFSFLQMNLNTLYPLKWRDSRTYVMVSCQQSASNLCGKCHFSMIDGSGSADLISTIGHPTWGPCCWRCAPTTCPACMPSPQPSMARGPLRTCCCCGTRCSAALGGFAAGPLLKQPKQLTSIAGDAFCDHNHGLLSLKPVSTDWAILTHHSRGVKVRKCGRPYLQKRL